MTTPILVRPRSENEYELVSGERRWRAAKELGWETIQAICEEMTDAEAAARAVTENEVRADTNVMEKAAGYKRLTQPPCSFTLEEIATRYGYRSHTSVVAIIALLDQPAAIQELVARATIGERHVRFLSRIKDLNARVKLAKRAAEEDWSVKETEKRVAKTLAKVTVGEQISRHFHNVGVETLDDQTPDRGNPLAQAVRPTRPVEDWGKLLGDTAAVTANA